MVRFMEHILEHNFFLIRILRIQSKQGIQHHKHRIQCKQGIQHHKHRILGIQHHKHHIQSKHQQLGIQRVLHLRNR